MRKNSCLLSNSNNRCEHNLLVFCIKCWVILYCFRFISIKKKVYFDTCWIKLQQLWFLIIFILIIKLNSSFLLPGGLAHEKQQCAWSVIRFSALPTQASKIRNRIDCHKIGVFWQRLKLIPTCPTKKHVIAFWSSFKPN